MNVTCSGCRTQYKIDETKVPATGGFIRCKTCGERIRIPPPGEAIPLAGSDSPSLPASPPPAPVAAPPATTEMPAGLSAAIPLPETAAATPSASAFPLPEAPKLRPDPLAETRVVTTPSLPVQKASAIPLPETATTEAGPEAETRIVSTPALPPAKSTPIPLAGTAAEAPVKSAPIPLAGSAHEPGPAAAMPLSLSTQDLDDLEDADATQITDTPHFLDSLPEAPAALAADDLPDMAVPAEARGRAEYRDLPTPDSAEPATAIVDDLPVPVSAASEPVITDLPTPAPEGDLPLANDADLTVTKAVVYDDLPVEARPEPTDLPRVDEAPRLMDDLPIADTTQPANAAPVAETTAAVAELMTAEAAKPPAAPATPSTAPEHKTKPAAEKPARKRSGLILGLGAGVGVALAAVALVALATPWLGLQQFDPLGLAAKKPISKPIEPSGTPAANAAGKTPPIAPAPQQPTPPAPPPKAVVVTLTADNVDALRWSELSLATAALAKTAAADDTSAQGLLKWARFRLARVYGDEEAKKILVEASAEKPVIAKLDALGAAGTVGALILAGKVPLARKLGESLLKAKAKASPELAWALATTYDHRPELQKGLKQSERALKAAPEMIDARFLHASLALATRDKEAGASALVELVAKDRDPDLAVRAAEAMLAASEVTAMDDAVDSVQEPAQAERLPPAHRGAFLKLLVRKKLRAGDVEGALTAAQARVKVEPTSNEASIELGRLTAATGGDPLPVLKGPSAGATDLDRAHFLAERVRLLLRQKDVDGARKALATGAELDPKEAGGWLKLAEGMIAEKSGQLTSARAAYAAALKGRPKFAPARLAQALLAADKPGVLLKKLSDMDKGGELPEATLELARLMQARGNPGGASQLFDRVLWTDPTLSEPVELVLQWADTLDQAGQQNRAEAIVKSLHDARPDDARPVHQLIAMARRGKRYDAAVDWYRLLVAADPKNTQLEVGLAEVLNDAGKPAEAQGLLDALFKKTPAAKDADALAQLARAWSGRDDFKAKELFDESLRLKPQAKTYMLKGAAEEKRGKTDDAEVAYKKALELEPDLVAASLSLARMAIERRSFPQAVTALEQVLARSPQHAKAAELLGDAFTELNKPREAIVRYEVALAASGENALLLMKIAKLQNDSLGQTEEATKSFRRAIKADPKLADPHYYLGLALKDANLRGEAKNELQAYLRLAPEGENAADAKQAVADLEKP